MAIIIRKVDPTQYHISNTLRYLQKKCLPYDTVYDVLKGHWWIAYVDGCIPVGFAGLVRSKTWWDCGYMCRAGVIEEYQGQGIQKRLIRVRIAKAKKMNWNWIITDTRDNPASSNSLISMGFKLYNPTKPYGFKNSLYWRKRLNAVQRPRNKKKKSG